MANIRWVFIFIGLAALLVSCMAGASFALPDQVYEERGSRELMGQKLSMRPMADPAAGGVLVDVFNSGRGFALKDNESHLLRFNVESIRCIEPLNMRRLLASNKSLEEIRQEIKAKDGNMTYRGSIMLDGNIYPLHGIIARASGDNITTVDADVAEPRFGEVRGNETTTVGHITVTTYPSDIGSIGKGKLTINYGQHSGSYNVLLDMLPPLHERRRGLSEIMNIHRLMLAIGILELAFAI